MPGLVWAYRFHADGSAEELGADAPIELRHDGWLWLHLDLSDGGADDIIARFCPIAAAAAHFKTAAPRSQIQVIAEGIFGTIVDVERRVDGTAGDPAQLHFVATERLLISGRHRTLNAADAARRTLAGGRKIVTATALLELLVEHVIEGIDDAAGEIDEALDEIEEVTATARFTDQRRRVGVIRKTAVRLHRQLQGLRVSFGRLRADHAATIGPELATIAARLAQRLDGLDHEIVALRDRAHMLQEEMSLMEAEATNRHLHFLAIVTTVFLPPTLITGIFGMNVKGLPLTDDEAGFFWAMILLALAAAGALVLLGRRGLFRRRRGLAVDRFESRP